MEISEQPPLLGFEDESQFCQQVFPANQPPLPGSDEARKMTVGSGRQLSMLLNQSNPLGQFSKILLESSLWTSSGEFSYVWNRLDTRFALSAFQLTPLGLSTDGNGCLLWPTANANDWKGPNATDPTSNSGHGLAAAAAKLWPTPVVNDARNGRNATANRSNPDSKHHAGTTLSDAVRLWPTPTVPNGGRRNPEGTSITGKKPGGGKAQIDIREFAIRMLPTPTARDWKSTSHGNQGNARPLSEVAGLTGSGSLNPRFVEELMGFRIDHTALKPSATQ
jgi:hypothetical protein